MKIPIRNGNVAMGVCMAAVLGCSHAAVAGDWPQWRGPGADGISKESDWKSDSLDGAVTLKWRAELGEGYSSVSVSDGRLYSMGNEKDQDRVVCLDAGSGAEVWVHAYPCKKGSYAGPRATPVVDSGRVYALSREGNLLCLDAKGGAVVWERQVLAGTEAENIGWGLSSSPVIAGDRVLINAGASGAAFNTRTGEPLWTSAGKGGYSAAVLYPSDAPVAAVLFSGKTVCGVDILDGKVLWSHPWETSYDVNAADPIVDGDTVFITSGYGRGCALVRVAGDKTTTVWENKRLCSQFSSAVLIGGFVYGIDGNAGNGTLRCIAYASGNESWAHETGFGSVIAAGNRLIVLTEKGDLLVAEATSEAYRQLARADGAVPVDKGAKCWTSPVLANGLLYARTSKGTLVCIDASK